MGQGLASTRIIRADLHIHTALSPCGGDEMTPPAIVAAARERGLDMIAISDHNTVGNVGATQEAARLAGDKPAVLTGMEITSVEEVHILSLFPDLTAAEEVATTIRGYLPSADAGYYSFFGEQPKLAADGRVIGSETACLALATPFALTECVAMVHNAGGLAIAAHVDRKSFSVFSQLGFFPQDAGLDGVELSRHLHPESEQWEEFEALGLPLIRSSDSHYPEDLGVVATELRLEAPTFSELVLAFAGKEGRAVLGRTRGGEASGCADSCDDSDGAGSEAHA